MSEALSTLRGDFDKLVSGDTTTAIKSFNEVIAFLDGIQDTIGTRVCLDESVHFQVLVHPQSIQSSCIEAGQEHVDYNQQVQFLVLHTQGYILVVVLECITGSIIVGIKLFIVVINSRIKKVTG